MKVNYLLLTVITLTALLKLDSKAQNPSFGWAKQMGGSNIDISTSVSLGKDGSIYTTGLFVGTADFDPSSNLLNLVSSGQTDIFIQKLDSAGNLLWAKKMGGQNSDVGSATVAHNNGGIYTIGYFSGIVDFDPSSGVTNLTTSAGSRDLFIQKLDSNGNFSWVKQISGTNINTGNAIITDSQGDIYISGGFSGTTDFDPDTNTVNLTTSGSSDIFLLKLDINGNFIWVRQMGGPQFDIGFSVTTDMNDNLYITGVFNNTADFDPGPGIINLTSAGDNDMFIQKFNSNGNLIWTKQMGSSNRDDARSITSDSFGNIYTTGYFRGTVDFDPNAGIFNMTPIGTSDMFIQKLDTNGVLVWSKQMGGSDVNGSTVKVDNYGYIYTTGNFSSTADFNPGVNSYNLTSSGLSDIFIQKLNPNGNFIWASSFGGSGYDWGNSMVINSKGDIYTTGKFTSTADLDPGIGVTNYTTHGNDDIFIQKLSQSNFITNLNQSSVDSEKFIVFPNPTTKNITIDFKTFQESIEVRIYSVTGQLLEIMSYKNLDQINIEINQRGGIYLLEVIDSRGNTFKSKIIKQG